MIDHSSLFSAPQEVTVFVVAVIAALRFVMIQFLILPHYAGGVMSFGFLVLLHSDLLHLL